MASAHGTFPVFNAEAKARPLLVTVHARPPLYKGGAALFQRKGMAATRFCKPFAAISLPTKAATGSFSPRNRAKLIRHAGFDSLICHRRRSAQPTEVTVRFGQLREQALCRVGRGQDPCLREGGEGIGPDFERPAIVRPARPDETVKCRHQPRGFPSWRADRAESDKFPSGGSRISGLTTNNPRGFAERVFRALVQTGIAADGVLQIAAVRHDGVRNSVRRVSSAAPPPKERGVIHDEAIDRNIPSRDRGSLSGGLRCTRPTPFPPCR